MEVLIRLWNTVINVWTLITYPLALCINLTPLGKKMYTPVMWKYLFTHGCIVSTTQPSNFKVLRDKVKRLGSASSVGYGLSTILLYDENATNMGVLYHELGHCVVPEAAPTNLKGGKIHLTTEPAPNEIAADMYAVRNGYGQELYDFLAAHPECPDTARRCEIIKQEMEKMQA